MSYRIKNDTALILGFLAIMLATCNMRSGGKKVSQSVPVSQENYYAEFYAQLSRANKVLDSNATAFNIRVAEIRSKPREVIREERYEYQWPLPPPDSVVIHYQ